MESAELYKCLGCGKLLSTHNRSGFCTDCKAKTTRNERRVIVSRNYRKFQKEDKAFKPGKVIKNSFQCPACKGTGFDVEYSTSCPNGIKCDYCKGTGRVALYVEEKCPRKTKDRCNQPGAPTVCLRGFVKRLCDTDKGIYKRLLTSDELKDFAMLGDQLGGGMDYITDRILKKDNAKMNSKPVRLMSIARKDGLE